MRSINNQILMPNAFVLTTVHGQKLLVRFQIFRPVFKGGTLIVADRFEQDEKYIAPAIWHHRRPSPVGPNLRRMALAALHG